ncbi:MAG: AbrB/MazE/SpoVT family DNA-binding domain-containing protein [Candidatus Bathyarchaeia archaeon]
MFDCNSVDENMVKVILKIRKKGILILPKSLREAAGINEGEVVAEARGVR